MLASSEKLGSASPYRVVDFSQVAGAITDVGAPVKLLKSIRQGQVRPHTPVVLFTGEVSPRRVVEAMESGANGFVTKPFVTATLCDKVLRIVASLSPVTEFIPVPRPSRPPPRPRA